jgi:hypothetical protein
MSNTTMNKVLLGFIAAAAVFLVLRQNAEMRAMRERAVVLQQQLSAEEKRRDELRKRMEALREEMERVERIWRKNERKGDHWLPGELERLRNISPPPPPLCFDLRTDSSASTSR